MAHARDVHLKHVRQALLEGEYRWNPHSYERLQGTHGTLLLYYVQGMLLSIWHLESGVVAHIPIVWPQDFGNYHRQQRKFGYAVDALREEYMK